MTVCTLAVIYMCSNRLRLLHVAGENLDVNAVLTDLRIRQVGVCFGHSLRYDRYFVRLSALRGAVQLLLQTVLASRGTMMRRPRWMQGKPGSRSRS